ncbi:MAG: ankyrin repeat domain-containing protein [Gammaproteobacteria bacterium]|nr:ankyrin repeat domain-containing protein [Gammaproteobacteria bacterium]
MRRAETLLLLEAGANPNERCGRGESTVLHHAAAKLDSAAVSVLLGAGADPDARDFDGLTPLHHAGGDLRTAKALLDAGAAPNSRALYSEARIKGLQDISPGDRGSGFTPLLHWMGVGRELGGEDQQRRENATGKRLEELRARGAAVDLIQLLVDRGADVNARGTRGEHVLHRYRSAGIARVLLAAGADVNAQDDEGRTPLHNAPAEAVRIYLEAGADPNRRDNTGQTPLFTRSTAEGVNALVAGGADPQLRDLQGRTPLFGAFPPQQQAYLGSMLAAGIDINAQDKRGRMALDEQLMRRLEGTRESTRRRDPNRSDFSRFVTLLEHGADPNIPDEYGNTTLHLAAQWCPLDDFIGALLEHGADLNRLNGDGLTAWELAQFNPLCVRMGHVPRLWNPAWKAEGVPGATAASTQTALPALTHGCATPQSADERASQTPKPTFTDARGSAALTGPACIIDADTIEVAGVRVHLFAIDAPERDQLCGQEPGGWRCGYEAMRALDNLIEAESIICDKVYQLSNGDVLGTCYAGSKDKNINQWMVWNGWAFSDGDPELREEIGHFHGYYAIGHRARRFYLGLWRQIWNKPQPPWEWRAERGLSRW